jgi:hypothetical protein
MFAPLENRPARRLFLDGVDVDDALARATSEAGLEVASRLMFHPGDEVELVMKKDPFEITFPVRVAARRGPRVLVLTARDKDARRAMTVRRTTTSPAAMVFVDFAEERIHMLLEILLAGGNIKVGEATHVGTVLLCFRGSDGETRIALRGDFRGGAFQLGGDRASRNAARAYVNRQHQTSSMTA